MKKLFLSIILICLIPFHAQAIMPGLMDIWGDDGGATPGCSSYQPTDADICCQDADGATAIANTDAVSRGGTWVATQSGTNSISAAAVSAGISCTDEGTSAFEISADPDQGTDAYIEEDGFSMTNHSGKFMISINFRFRLIFKIILNLKRWNFHLYVHGSKKIHGGDFINTSIIYPRINPFIIRRKYV